MGSERPDSPRFVMSTGRLRPGSRALYDAMYPGLIDEAEAAAGEMRKTSAPLVYVHENEFVILDASCISRGQLQERPTLLTVADDKVEYLLYLTREVPAAVIDHLSSADSSVKNAE